MSVHNFKAEAEQYNDSVASGTDVDLGNLDITVNSISGAAGVAASFPGGIDVDGVANGIIVDADGDTTIESPTDDTLEINIGGSVKLQLTSSALALATGVGLTIGGSGTVTLPATADLLLVSNTIAAAGTNLATATAITGLVSNVTGGNDTTGVALPTAVAGDVRLVYNAGSAGLNVYGNTSDTVNGAASVVMLEATLALFVALSDSNWGAIYTVNS